jgi:hypothetical protein
MDYILKSATSQAVPYTNKDSVYGIDAVVTTGIVGQTYDGFINLDVIFCPVEKTDTIDEIEVKIGDAARAYILVKYPNT